MRHALVHSLAAFTAVIVTGCATHPQLLHSDQCIREHVIAIDNAGRPHDPTIINGKAWEMDQYRNQIAEIFSAIGRAAPAPGGRKILIFVHGGLNAPEAALHAADVEIDRVTGAGYYPIYLNWNSDIFDSYGEHLTRITQGQTQTGGRVLLTPLYLLADIGRAATRIPIVWTNQLSGDLQAAAGDFTALPLANESDIGGAEESQAARVRSSRWAQRPGGTALADKYLELRVLEKDDKKNRKGGDRRTAMNIYIGPDLDKSAAHMAWLDAMYVLKSPVKFGAQPLIDEVGTPAWEVMARRTLMAFDGDLGGNPSASFALAGAREHRGSRAKDFTETGAIEVFRELLEEYADGGKRDPRPTTQAAATRPSHSLTLVGHSMGVMILNEWLRRDLLERTYPHYDDIVYMAAACSIRDFGRSVVPYLLQNGQTRFYNLMLHPLADLRESEAWDLAPRGSLLVWLDSFLADPQTPLDHTLGRWDNIIPALEVIPDSIRGQITLKAFTLAPDDCPEPKGIACMYGPQQHGDFRGQPYWCKSFWSDETPEVRESPCTPSEP